MHTYNIYLGGTRLAALQAPTLHAAVQTVHSNIAKYLRGNNWPNNNAYFGVVAAKASLHNQALCAYTTQGCNGFANHMVQGFNGPAVITLGA